MHHRKISDKKICAKLTYLLRKESSVVSELNNLKYEPNDKLEHSN